MAPGADITGRKGSECDKQALGGTVTHSNERYICKRSQHTKTFDE